MATGPEYAHVELPFLQQLQRLGWTWLEGDTGVPYLTDRGSFREVLLVERLRAALRRINLDDDGQPWLDEARISQAVAALQRLGAGAPKLIEANQQGTDLLLRGAVVDGDPERHGGKGVTVRYIDFDHPERNEFLAINQFRVDPPWAVGARDAIIPDIVLFVNGIPLVVVECKSPFITDPIDAAITQLLQYSNAREWVQEPEGAERLFWFNQLTVATSFDDARIGTVGASYPHYIQWKDTSPVPLAQVKADLGLPADREPSSQQLLVAGALRPAHLLDLVRHFIVFQPVSGRTVKIAGRYQQFRAVQQAVARLRTGKTKREDGEHDRRGGIVWHTQGSGKSLTMVFLVRKLRTLPELRRFKVVVVTDRTDLERQLKETAQLIGENVRVARTSAQLRTLLAEDSPDLVFAMIQKYQPQDEDEQVAPAPPAPLRIAAEETVPYDIGQRLPNRLQQVGEAEEVFPVLNESEQILVLVDEAHRSHSNTLHANLRRALPNAALIGFTGTPILIGAQKRTHEIFGSFIDRYTIKQAEDDGVTVPILYEGREVEPVVIDGRTLDDVFDEAFGHLSPADRERLKRDEVTQSAILEAPQLIRAKARDMLRHYVTTVLPDGFKAQVVATSRKAAVRYQQELTRARDDLVREVERFRSPSGLHAAGTDGTFLEQATAHLDLIRELEFAAVISGRQHDDRSWDEWSDPGRQASRIARFKRPLIHDDPSRRDRLAFLCVKSMLLTGFDAPVEQVLYLDRAIRGHELLQAIARVNRTEAGKQHGLIVDYYGVTRELTEALAVYRAEDVRGALTSIRDQLPVLSDRHRRVVALFVERGASIDDSEACVHLLRDPKLRAEFRVKLAQFLETLGIVLPRAEALPFVGDARTLGLINQRARNRYRDEQLNLHAEGEKVRALIDAYVSANGINPKIAPLSILDANFDAHVAGQSSSRSAATEMEYAARHHISQHYNEDPVQYRRFSQRLEELIERYGENWDQLALQLKPFIEQLRAGRQQDDSGLNAWVEAPFYDVLVDDVQRQNGAGELTAEQRNALAEATVEIVAHVRQEVATVDFWRNQVAQQHLRNWIIQYLDDHNLLPFDQLAAAADRLVQLAKQRHGWLVE